MRKKPSNQSWNRVRVRISANNIIQVLLCHRHNSYQIQHKHDPWDPQDLRDHIQNNNQV